MLRGLELTTLHKQENLEEAVLIYSILFPSFDEKNNCFPVASEGSVLWFGFTSASTESCSSKAESTSTDRKTNFIFLVLTLYCLVYDTIHPNVSESPARGDESF